MRSLVPLLLLTFSLHAAPPLSISPERPVAPLALADATLFVNSSNGRVASDGHSFLAAWTASYTTGLGAILTASIDADGHVGPAVALPYRVDADLLALGWTGETYRLVWQDRADLTINAADVDGNGNLVHPRVTLGRALYFRAAAFLPDRTLIVLRDSSDRAAVIGTDGTVVRSDFAVQAVAVTSDDHGFMLFSANATLQFTSTLQMQHLTGDGVVDGDAVSIGSTGVVYPIAAAFNSGHYAVTLFESVVASSGIVQSYAVRRFVVDASGHATELAPFPVGMDQTPVQVVHVIPDGGGFLAWWKSGSNELATVRFSAGTDGSIERRHAEMLPTDSVWLAAGARELGIDGTLAGFYLDSASTFRVARYPVAQMPHGIASLGNQSLVVWSELDDPPYSDTRVMLAMRIDANGTPLDREPLRLGSAHWYSPTRADIAVVAAGSRYWIAWPSGETNNPTVLLRSVETSGALGELVTTPFHGDHLALATDGSILLLAFSDDSVPLSAARFLANGTLLDPLPIVLGSPVSVPRVSWTGETFVVAWSEGSSPCSRFCVFPYLQRQVVTARVSASGVDLDPAPIALTPAHPASDGLEVTAIASRAGETLVAWTEKGAAMTVNALQPLPSGYLAFAARSTDTRVLEPDGEEAGAFEGVTIAATQRSDGKWVILESRPADAREAAGATQVFTRVVSLAPPRLRAVRALLALPPTAPLAWR